MPHVAPMNNPQDESREYKEFDANCRCRRCDQPYNVRCRDWKNSDGVYLRRSFKCLSCGYQWWTADDDT